MQKKRIGVVADDITGSNDIGAMLAGNGYVTGIFSLNNMPETAETIGLDAIIINTDTRLDDTSTAADKTENATRFLQSLPCDMYYSKTCSVFRGNIGVQFDAMQHCLNAACSMVVLGFPRNGRTTVHGTHYVNGVPLENTMFRHDPIHPMTQSNLQSILSGQSTGRVAVFDAASLDLPQKIARAELERLKAENEYIIFDVRNQQDLKTIAALIADEASLCGSSAICEELPKAWTGGHVMENPFRSLVHKIIDPCGTLVVSGSLTKTAKEQVQNLLRDGIHGIELPVLKLFREPDCHTLAVTLSVQLSEMLMQGSPALLYTPQDNDQIAKIKETGLALGYNEIRIGRMISSALTEIVGNIANRTGLKKVIAAGGETSSAVANGLQIRKMVILQEIEAGLPAMYGYTAQGYEMLLVFKSGSFGSPDFLQKSISRLKELQEGYLP